MPAGAGVYDDNGNRLPDVSWAPNGSLELIIVAAWASDRFKQRLLTGGSLKGVFASMGLHVADPVVITEDQYASGYTMKSPNQTVFVLPNQVGPPLLDVARALMAITPHGI